MQEACALQCILGVAGCRTTAYLQGLLASHGKRTTLDSTGTELKISKAGIRCFAVLVMMSLNNYWNLLEMLRKFARKGLLFIENASPERTARLFFRSQGRAGLAACGTREGNGGEAGKPLAIPRCNVALLPASSAMDGLAGVSARSRNCHSRNRAPLLGRPREPVCLRPQCSSQRIASHMPLVPLHENSGSSIMPAMNQKSGSFSIQATFLLLISFDKLPHCLLCLVVLHPC